MSQFGSDQPSKEPAATPWPQRFSRWLAQAHALAEQPPAAELEPDAASEARGQSAMELAQALAALRQELRQQSKETRRLAHHAEQTLGELDQRRDQDLLPVLEELCTLEESLSLAVREARATRDRCLEAADRAPDGEASPEAASKATPGPMNPPGDAVSELIAAQMRTFDRMPWWRRWAARRYHQVLLERLEDLRSQAGTPAPLDAARPDPATEPIPAENDPAIPDADDLGTLADGLGMIHDRLKQLLTRCGVQRVACEGQPVDPHRMSVLEAEDEPDVTPGCVVREIRPGYVWGQRVLRLAQVTVRPRLDQAAAGPVTDPDELEDEPDADPSEMHDGETDETEQLQQGGQWHV